MIADLVDLCRSNSHCKHHHIYTLFIRCISRKVKKEKAKKEEIKKALDNVSIGYCLKCKTLRIGIKGCNLFDWYK